MAVSPEDILYNVKMLSYLTRYDESINMFDNFLAIKQKLDKNERDTFFSVYKTCIDSSRYSYRSIDAYYQQNVEDGNQEVAEKLLTYRDMTAEKIITTAQKAIEIIDDTLLGMDDDPAAQGFYYKTKGDMWRYITETSSQIEKGKGTVQGKEAYMRALEICNESLDPVDPTRLGVILNAAVFRYEHLNEKTEAIQMLEDAVQVIKNNQPIAEENMVEVSNAFNTMETNLRLWATGAMEEEEEQL